MLKANDKEQLSMGFNVAKQTALYQQHLDKAFCDVLIKLKDEEFYVHSCIVAAACPKLQQLLNDKKEVNMSTNAPAYSVELEEDVFTPKVFEFILSYMYLGVLDWSKVAPALVNQVLDAAHWCEFNQLIEDYMSMNNDEEQDIDDAGSTIVMVDTFDHSGTEEQIAEEVEQEEVLEKDGQGGNELFSDDGRPSLYCVICGARFEAHDDVAFDEHMRNHEMDSDQDEEGDIQSPRRQVTRRKASMNIRNKYQSLIPHSKAGASNESNDTDNMKLTKKTTKKTAKNRGRVSMFRKEYICQLCDKKLPSQKALNLHVKEQCEARIELEQVEELTTEEIAGQLLSELAQENEGSSILRSTKGLTVETGSYVRGYSKKKRGEGMSFKKKVKTTKLWICPRCPDIVFERKRDQLHHIRSVHGVIKRHVCDRCGKSLDGRTALELHMRIHTGERPFACPTCGRGFSEKKTMLDHTRRHTGERPFLCTVCGKDFAYRQSLYRHMKFHTGERPYKCGVCSKTFVLRQNLREHELRHEKHTLIKCNDCQLTFSTKEQLLHHQLEAHVKTTHERVVEETVVMQDGHHLNVIDIANNQDGVTSYEVTIENRMLESLCE